MGSLRGLVEGPPDCLVCDGPCSHEFDRSPYQIGGNMPKAKDGSTDPEPRRKQPPRRGRRKRRDERARHLDEDRMRRPDEDR